MGSTIKPIKASDNCRGHRADLLYYIDNNGDLIEWNTKSGKISVHMTSEEIDED